MARNLIGTVVVCRVSGQRLNARFSLAFLQAIFYIVGTTYLSGVPTIPEFLGISRKNLVSVTNYVISIGATVFMTGTILLPPVLVVAIGTVTITVTVTVLPVTVTVLPVAVTVIAVTTVTFIVSKPEPVNEEPSYPHQNNYQ